MNILPALVVRAVLAVSVLLIVTAVGGVVCCPLSSIPKPPRRKGDGESQRGREREREEEREEEDKLQSNDIKSTKSLRCQVKTP